MPAGGVTTTGTVCAPVPERAVLAAKAADPAIVETLPWYTARLFHYGHECTDRGLAEGKTPPSGRVLGPIRLDPVGRMRTVGFPSGGDTH